MFSPCFQPHGRTSDPPLNDRSTHSHHTQSLPCSFSPLSCRWVGFRRVSVVAGRGGPRGDTGRTGRIAHSLAAQHKQSLSENGPVACPHLTLTAHVDFKQHALSYLDTMFTGRCRWSSPFMVHVDAEPARVPLRVPVPCAHREVPRPRRPPRPRVGDGRKSITRENLRAAPWRKGGFWQRKGPKKGGFCPFHPNLY